MPLRMAKPLDVRALRRVAAGKKVTTLRRLGKYLLIDTEANATVVVHLGMSGRLSVVKADAARAPHTHVIFALEGGHELRFVDPRRFGWLTTGRPGAEKDLEELAVLGVDPLAPGFTAECLHALARSSRRPMKSFLSINEDRGARQHLYGRSSVRRGDPSWSSRRQAQPGTGGCAA